MQKNVTLLPPMMPNFISYTMGIESERQEGFDPEKNKIDIKNLSKEEAEQYGELMKQTFIAHWESKCK